MAGKSGQKGAVSVQRKPLSILPLLKTVGMTLLLTVLLVGAGLGVAQLYRVLDKPVAVIAVQGEFEYASREQIAALVGAELKGGFLSMNLDHIKTQLEQDPWIESAVIGRRWPDELVINVVEETPIARWNDNSFVNSRGEALAIENNARLAQLPLLLGPQGATREVMEQYRHAAQLLLPTGLKTMEFRLDERNAWRLLVKGDGIEGLNIYVGQGGVTEKLKRFLAVYNTVLRERKADIDKVDARYPNGVAVSWREAGNTGNRLALTTTPISP